MIAKEALCYLEQFPESPNCVSMCWYALANPINSDGLTEAIQANEIQNIYAVQIALFHELALQGRYMISTSLQEGQNASDQLMEAYHKLMFHKTYSKLKIQFNGAMYLSSEGNHAVAVTSIMNRSAGKKKIRILDVASEKCERVVDLNWLDRRTKNSRADVYGSRGFATFTFDLGLDFIRLALKDLSFDQNKLQDNVDNMINILYENPRKVR
jgi:hypothetical protein